MKVSRFSTKKLERVMSEFWKENDELRELLAWRSAEAERPENGTFCLIILKNSAWPNVIQYVEGVLWNPEFITHWRPIGPLPELGCDNMEGESEKDEYAESVVMYMNIVKHMWANSRLSNFGYDSMTDEMKRAFNRVVGKPIGDRNT